MFDCFEVSKFEVIFMLGTLRLMYLPYTDNKSSEAVEEYLCSAKA